MVATKPEEITRVEDPAALVEEATGTTPAAVEEATGATTGAVEDPAGIEAGLSAERI